MNESWEFGDKHECPISSKTHLADAECVEYAVEHGDSDYRPLKLALGTYQPIDLVLPAPAGVNELGKYWERTDGSRVFVRDGQVFERGGRTLDALERDALAVLAAVAWARGMS